MAESTIVLAAICGALLACAPVFVIFGRRSAPLRLSDALARLSGHGVRTSSSNPRRRVDDWNGGERKLRSGGRRW